MNNGQNPGNNWALGILIASSIPILLILVGIIAMLGGAGRTDPVTGINNTTVENAVLFGGLYCAIPSGLSGVIVGVWAQARKLIEKRFAIAGIILGMLSILVGLLSWASFVVVSSFVF